MASIKAFFKTTGLITLGLSIPLNAYSENPKPQAKDPLKKQAERKVKKANRQEKRVIRLWGEYDELQAKIKLHEETQNLSPEEYKATRERLSVVRNERIPNLIRKRTANLAYAEALGYVEEMNAEIGELQTLMSAPGVTEEDRKIYQEKIIVLKKGVKIIQANSIQGNSLQGKNPQTGVTPSPTPTPTQTPQQDLGKNPDKATLKDGVKINKDVKHDNKLVTLSDTEKAALQECWELKMDEPYAEITVPPFPVGVDSFSEKQAQAFDQQVQNIVEDLKKHSNYRIGHVEVIASSSAIGSKAFNEALSKRRAQTAIKAFNASVFTNDQMQNTLFAPKHTSNINNPDTRVQDTEWSPKKYALKKQKVNYDNLTVEEQEMIKGLIADKDGIIGSVEDLKLCCTNKYSLMYFPYQYVKIRIYKSVFNPKLPECVTASQRKAAPVSDNKEKDYDKSHVPGPNYNPEDPNYNPEHGVKPADVGTGN